MKALFPQFDADHIAEVMSLRKSRKISLKRLAGIPENAPVPLSCETPKDESRLLAEPPKKRLP